MKSFIENEVETVKQTYIRQPLRIISDFNNEREKIKEYNGRQLLEMLQNADDEANNTEKKTAYIELNNQYLIIANNGNRFSEAGITSLMYSNVSPKFKEQNKIGNKGTGFRSILSWAKTIYIKSYDFSIEFSQTNAINFLQDLIKENPSISEKIKDKSDEEFPIATLLTPQLKELNNDEYSKYDTYIIIELKENVKDDIQQQINELDKEVLLFLHNLEKIIIDSPDRKETLKKDLKSKTNVEIQTLSVDEEIKDRKVWKINISTGTYINKNYELKIAYNDNLDDNKNILYSYFRTNVHFPFPAIVHGTFDLSGNRNELNESVENEFLLKELAQLIINTALDITKTKEDVSWNALKLLTFDEVSDPVIEKLHFKDILLEKIKENKLFPSIANKYLSHADEPVFYKNPYGNILPSENFPNLTIFTDDKKILSLIDKIGLYTYNIEWFFSQINSISNKLEVHSRAKLIKYIIDDFSEQIKKLSKENFPTLFIDDKGKVIPATAEIMLPPEINLFKIPDYFKIKFLSNELFNELCTDFAVKGARAIAEKLILFNIQEYRFDTVLRKIINQTEEEIKYKKSKRIEYIRKFIQCLWELFNKTDKLEAISPTVNIPLLNRYRVIMNAKELYLGKEYGNNLTENLFKNVNQNIFVASSKILGLENDNKSEVKNFLLWLGVAEYPRISVTRISHNKEYEHFVYKKLTYPKNIDPDNFNSSEELIDLTRGNTVIEIETIEQFDSILEKADYEDVLIWFIKDLRVFNRINSAKEFNQNSRFLILFYQKSNYRVLHSKDISSYLLWSLGNKKWIKPDLDTI